MVCHSQVRLAVAVEVAHCHRNSIRSRAVLDRNPEGTISCAQQHRNLGGALVGHDDVGFAIAVEVTHHHGLRLRPRAVVEGGLEGAIALAQKHRDAPVGFRILRRRVTLGIRDG